ncbi:MAG: NAD(P)-binding domain-containing protein, partial [Rhizomicrobium sp.]
MARNLLKAHEDVCAFDLKSYALREFTADGGRVAKSVSAAVRGADIVISMLPTGTHVRSAYLKNGIVLAAKKGALLIDCSTIDIDSARAVHTAASKAGFDFLDAPVSGGVGGAEAGTLAFMCGGSD